MVAASRPNFFSRSHAGPSSRTRPARPRGARDGQLLAQDSADGFAQTADNVVLLGSDDLAALLSSLDDDLLVQGLDGVDVDDPGVDTLGSQLLGSPCVPR